MISVPKNARLRTFGGPLLQSHRGSRGEYEDNAAGGFKWCLENGIRGFETDVHFTKDHELVIMHDANVSRTTDGNGRLEEMTLEEVRKLRLNACSEQVPLAKEVLETFRGRDDVFVEIEMKAYPDEFYTPEVLEEYCRKLNELARGILVEGTYAFTCFNLTTLATMRRVAPDASIGYIMLKLEKQHIRDAVALGCCNVAPTLDTSEELVREAHKAGLAVTLWMVQNVEDYAIARKKGADRVTSDYPHLLLNALAGKRKKVVALDLDATLCQHRSAIPWKNLTALEALCARYKCVMIGAGNPQRIYNQMGEFPIDIVGNYGMQIAEAADGNFHVTQEYKTEVDREFFRRETDRLRTKYGYTSYCGDPLEFHESGMVTFGLLGTTPSHADKLAFDPDRKKRRAMYAEVCEIFKDFSVYIGGSSSFDIAGREFNKFDATVRWAKEHGYELGDIVYIGDDFADGGGDSHVRIKGMDHIVISDFRNFSYAVRVLM